MRTLLDSIGHTPLIRIEGFNINPDVKILAKCEWFNPTGSIKDRIAKFIIEKAEERGELTHDKCLLESTSGNMGISLAMIGAIKKYRVLLTMSEAKSVERRKIIKAMGAELVLTSADDPDSNIKKVQELFSMAPEKYYLPDQNENEDNTLTHYETTGVEILEQTQGAVDYFVAGLGTAGTLMGVSKRLRDHNKSIRIISVEPSSTHHILEGLKSLKTGYIPPIYKPELIDDTYFINDHEAVQIARKLASSAGLFVGISSGAAMAAALELSQKIDSGNIVVIFPDSGLKYLSTSLLDGIV